MIRQAMCVAAASITTFAAGCDSDPVALTPAAEPAAAQLSATWLPPATWIPRGNLNVPRFGSAVALLSDGAVLLAGGSNTGAFALSSSESYSRVTGAWTITGSMNAARSAFRAVVLRNGQVLVAGGSNGATALASAELYDPATGTWTGTGAMGSARESYTATVLNDGRVLVAGGGDRTCSTGCGPYATAELYDPASGTWSPAASMISPRLNHTAIRLRDGKVLVTGGGSGCNPDCGISVHATAELYDPASNTWTPTDPMAIGRAGHSMTELKDGRVLVVGGGKNNNSDCVAAAEIFDPESGSWSVTGSMTTARCGHTASLLPNGDVLVAGGGSSSTPPRSSAEFYDSRSGAWVVAPPMIRGRWIHAAAVLPGGKVLVAGGGGAGMGRSEVYAVR